MDYRESIGRRRGRRWYENSTLCKSRPDPNKRAGSNSSEEEKISSWALFIMIMLLMTALFTSYLLQQKKIEAVHETVISIFAGMLFTYTC